MDVPRKDAKRKRQIKKVLYALIVVVIVGSVTYGVSRLKPAAPSVDPSTLYKGTVTRGTMLRNVRGLGTLVPEEIRYVPALNSGRVEKRLLQQGATVKADTVLIEMSNPELEQQLLDAESQLRAAEADLASLAVQLKKQYFDLQAAAATVSSDLERAQMEAQVFEDLGKKGLKSPLEVKTKEIERDNLLTRNNIEKNRMAIANDEIKARTASQDERVRQLRDSAALKKKQVDLLKVRAGIDGVLQLVQVEVGQQVTIGQNLARVANPNRLKAELKISETQAKDILPGQPVEVDTRNGIIPGSVARIDPTAQAGTVTVDVSLTGDLPKGARSDMSVDGTIQLEKLDNVLYVNRPVHGQENATIGLFKVDPDGAGAARIQVRLGRSSVNSIEIIDGLKEGDVVILSDTSQWDNNDRIRLN